MTKPKEYILRVICPDRFGVVAKVSTCLNESELFILESAHFGDPETNMAVLGLKFASVSVHSMFNSFAIKEKFFSKELNLKFLFGDITFTRIKNLFVSGSPK